RVFTAIAEGVRYTAAAAAASKLRLLPSAVNLHQESWRVTLSPDRHVIEVFDEIEQAHACNLLAMYSPAMQAIAGRSGVTADRVEGQHWRLGSEALYFPPVEWVSTAVAHRERIRRFLKESEGISRLERIEIFPAGEKTNLTVNSCACDGAVFLS